MQCEYFGLCGSCTLNTPYEEQLEFKKSYIKELFGELYEGDLELVSSSPSRYRTRAEFGLWHDEDGLSYTMGNSTKDGRVKIKACPKVCQSIADLMPVLLDRLSSSQALKSKVFGVEFIASKTKTMVILLYHKDIFQIQTELNALALELNIKLIARSRKKRLFFPVDCLDERLSQSLEVGEKSYNMCFGEGAFIQPNTAVNEKMIAWALNCVSKDQRDDLLELYCGYGNFTIPLSFKFKKVLATEISKSAVLSAKINCELNGANNISFTRLDADELILALCKDKEFRRLKDIDLKAYNFSHIFLDPPRAGLSPSVLEFAKSFRSIIYVSCNPTTLFRDISELKSSHYISKFAIFDQFANTHHLECGVLLKVIK